MKYKRIYVEITNICNKNCSFCSKDQNKKQEMSISQFEHILKEIHPYTNYLYLHVKGEPLLHSQLKEILDLCTIYNIKVNLTTNGTLLERQTPILITSSCIRQINISLHSFEEEDHYIEKILHFTKRALQETNIYVNYRFWALKDGNFTTKNLELLRKIEQFFQVDLIDQIKNQKNVTIKEHLFLSKDDLFEWPNLELPLIGKTGYCPALKNHLGILVDGTVIPCCLDSSGVNCLGNIFEDSFIDIMGAYQTRQIRQGFENNQMVTPLCQRCSYRTRFIKS